MPQFIAIDYSACTGCKECEVVCSLYHLGECNPERSAIRVMRREKDGLVFSLPLVCQQCEEPPCIEACPTEALSREGEPSALTVDEDKCSGCADCVVACPAGCIFMDGKRNIAICCDLCSGQPQCVALCHSNCLTLSNSDDKTNKDRLQNLARIIKEENLSGIVADRGGR